MNRSLLLPLGLILLISCSSADEEKNTTKPGDEITSRADTIKVPLRIEGMVESIRMYLLKPPKDFPIQFSTYIPVEMVAETASFENGSSISIIANFGGMLNKDARLTIFAFSPTVTTAKVHAKVAEVAQNFNATPGDSTVYTWAEKVYDLRDNTFGFLALGRKNDLWFYVLAAYPPRYGDGMVPRVQLILEKWQWANGKLLIGAKKERKR